MTDAQALKRLKHWQRRDRERWVDIELSYRNVLVNLFWGENPVRQIGCVAGVSVADCVDHLEKQGVMK